jgi:hypothetical protein
VLDMPPNVKPDRAFLAAEKICGPDLNGPALAPSMGNKAKRRALAALGLLSWPRLAFRPK